MTKCQGLFPFRLSRKAHPPPIPRSARTKVETCRREEKWYEKSTARRYRSIFSQATMYGCMRRTLWTRMARAGLRRKGAHYTSLPIDNGVPVCVLLASGVKPGSVLVCSVHKFNYPCMLSTEGTSTRPCVVMANAFSTPSEWPRTLSRTKVQ